MDEYVDLRFDDMLYEYHMGYDWTAWLDEQGTGWCRHGSVRLSSNDLREDICLITL